MIHSRKPTKSRLIPKGWTVFSLFLVFGLLLPGCLVTKEEHERLEQDLLAMQTHLNTLEEDQKKQTDESIQRDQGMSAKITQVEARMGEDNILDSQEVQELRRQIQMLTGLIEQNDHTTQVARMELSEKIDKLSRRVEVLEAKLGVSSDATPQAVTPEEPVIQDGSNIKDKKDLFRQGRKLIQKGETIPGRRLMLNFLKRFPKDSMADDAEIWIGNSYFDEKNYHQAAMTFQKVLDGYKNGDMQDRALFMLAKCFLGMGMKRDAKLFFEDLIFRYPGSRYTSKAKEEIDKLGDYN